MSTLRINNIEAKSVPASPTLDEKIKLTNSSGDVLVHIDGKTSGITTIGINTTDGNIKFDENSNVVVTGIITATKFVGSFELSGDLTIPDKIIHSGDTNTAIRFPAADKITLETSGTERFQVDSSGNVYVGGVGASATAGVLWLNDTSANASKISQDNGNSALVFGTGSGQVERLRITSGGQIFIGGNTGYNESASLISLATDDSAAANMLSDSSAIYNHTNPAFIHVQNRYNTGDGQEAGIIFHSKSSFNGSWAIYGKKTTSGFLSDLIFRNRTASSASAERLRIDSSGFITNTSQPTYSGVGYSGDGSILQSYIPAIKPSTIHTNIGSHFNTSTGVFTCPVSGKYLCVGNMSRRTNAYDWTGFYLLKNGVTQIQTWFPAAINNTPSGQAQPASPAAFKGSYFTYAPAGLSAVLTCSANDTIVFGYDNRYSTPIDDASVNAQIILIG